MASTRLAQTQVAYTRYEVEEYASSVPLGMERHVSVGRQFTVMQEREAIGIVAVALVARNLPKHRTRHLSEDPSGLQGIFQRTAHTQRGMLGEHQSQVGIESVACLTTRISAGLRTKVQHRIAIAITIAATEIAVVLLFAPAQTGDEG